MRSPTDTAPTRSPVIGELLCFSGILRVDGDAAYKAPARGHGDAIRLALRLASPFRMRPLQLESSVSSVCRCPG